VIRGFLPVRSGFVLKNSGLYVKKIPTVAACPGAAGPRVLQVLPAPSGFFRVINLLDV
jgi:hypothetical protein